jgi:hypothetical protein
VESWSDFQVGEVGWPVKDWDFDGLHFSYLLNVHETSSNSHLAINDG